jgi:glycosyltransferase involved in cell wall biosynthesis
MRVAIDFHSVTGFKQGTRTYTRNLVQGLLAQNLMARDQADEYLLYITRQDPAELPVFPGPGWRYQRVLPHQRLLRIPLGLPWRLMRDRVDVFHCQYVGPPLCPVPYVVTIHDIIHEYMPELYPPALKAMMSLTYPFSARRAARVITVSECAKADLIKYYGLAPEKIAVIYEGTDESLRPLGQGEQLAAIVKPVLERYKVTRPYLLYLGRLEPRKNVPRLIEAFDGLKKAGRLPHRLVIAGMRDFQHEPIEAQVRARGLTDEVVFTGGVDDADLPALINGATAFVYPSLAEGFGLPPLEAMACGTPVITSNVSAMAEIVGPAGLLVDPLDPGAIAQAIAAVVERPELAAELGAKGLARAAQFSWAKAARQTLEVFAAVHREGKAARRG